MVQRLTVVMLAISSLAAGCDPFENKMIGFCEDVLKERLKSPSGYSRLKVTEMSEPLSIEKWKADQLAGPNPQPEVLALRERMMRQNGITPEIFGYIIEYDAPNTFGTLIRTRSMCEYVSVSGSRDDATAFNVKVDGFDKTGWLVEQLKQARRSPVDK